MCICYWSPFGFHSIKSSFDFLQWFCWIVGYCSENQMLHMNWIHKLVWILRFVVVVVRRREVFGIFLAEYIGLHGKTNCVWCQWKNDIIFTELQFLRNESIDNGRLICWFGRCHYRMMVWHLLIICVKNR